MVTPSASSRVCTKRLVSAPKSLSNVPTGRDQSAEWVLVTQVGTYDPIGGICHHCLRSPQSGDHSVTIQELRDLVVQGESEQLEFKRSTGSLSDGIKTVCAMLNGSLPGFVLFGVNDRGDIVGQDVSARTREDVANELRKIEPPAFPNVETVRLDNGRDIIV